NAKAVIRFTFHANERLKRTRYIDTLFREGEAYSVFPLRFQFRFISRTDAMASAACMAVGVAKKHFRKSTARNAIKRKIREAWRHQKHLLYTQIPADKQLHVFISFTSRKIVSYTDIVAAIEKYIAEMSIRLEKNK